MIRSTVLATCILGLCTFALAQPITNVHQQKQSATTTSVAATNEKGEATAQTREVAADFTLGKIHCPAGVHYFVGYDPCIPPSPWDQK